MDRRSTADGPLDPVTFLIELGTPPMAARHFVPILRSEVTGAVCDLLPGSGSQVPANWLRATSFAALQITPGLLSQLEPALAPGHVMAGTLPAQLMYPISYELSARAQRQPRAAAEPAPSRQLLAFRGQARGMVDDLFGSYFGGRSQQGLELLTHGPAKAAAVLDDSGKPAWGGWVLLAAVQAIRSNPTLPRPGRPRRRLPWRRAGAQGAGLGLQLGETFAMAMALGLLDQAEGTA